MRCSIVIFVTLGCTQAKPTTNPTLVSDSDEARCPAANHIWLARSTLWRGDSDEMPTAWLVTTWAEHSGDVPSFEPHPLDDGNDVPGDLGSATVWLVRSDQPPCKAQATQTYTWGGDDGPTYSEKGYVLSGCEDLLDDEDAEPTLAIASDEPPTGCRLYDRYHVVTNSEEPGDPPKDDVVFPEALVKHKTGACPSPQHCVHRFQIKGYGPSFDDAIAYEVLNTWINESPKTSECGWDYENEHAVVFGDETIPNEEGRVLSAVLSDGVRSLLVLHDTDSMRIVQFDSGAKTRDRAYTYYLAHEEDGMYHSLAPYCGP